MSLQLGSPKQRAVLAALVVAGGRTVSVDQLVESVWGDHPPGRALLGVQAYISKLRSLFQGAGFEQVQVVRRAPGYALEGAAIDLVEFRSLVVQAEAAVGSGRWFDAYIAASRAVGLWRGPLLADFMDEPWVMSEAAPVAELFAQCREALATALLGESRLSEAVARSQALVEAYPLRERAWRLLIISLHRAGRSPEALEAFQRFATELDDQLGLEPGPDFRRLQTAILQHDRSIAAWPNQPGEPVEVPEPGQPDRSGHSASQEIAPAHDSPGPKEEFERRAAALATASVGTVSRGDALVGRQEQLSVIDAALDDVVGGGRQWLLLTGPAGIGKTRLGEEAGVLAQRKGALVVSTACPDDEGTPAWWPLRPLVSGLGSDPDAIFLPPAGVDADTMRFTVYQRLADLLASRAQDQPVLIIIDDAQWLDAASTRLLTFLIRSRGLSRTGLLLTVRDEEGEPAIPPVVTALGQEWAAVHVPVPSLDGVAATELLNQNAADEVAASEAFALTRRTGGNPLLLIEYARLPAAERHSGKIPIAARGLLNRRLRRLPEQVLHVLRAAAVAGETFELDLVAQVVELSLIDVIDRLDAAAAEKIIGPAPSGHGYQFLHALLRDELLLQVSVMRRQALHARVADALQTRGRDARTLVQRAQHLTAALAIIDPAVVEQACRDAAEDAETRWDWDTAARQWDAALTA
ncbi:MAG: BTAD domain-containing putative transcriptional regulator, partial [Janthinobacterium lividum]